MAPPVRKHINGTVTKITSKGESYWRACVGDTTLGPPHLIYRRFLTSEQAWKWVYHNDPTIIKGHYVESARPSGLKFRHGIQLRLFDAKPFRSSHELVTHRQASDLLGIDPTLLSRYIVRPDFPYELLPMKNRAGRRIYTLDQVASIEDWRSINVRPRGWRGRTPSDAYPMEYEADAMLRQAKKMSAGTKRKLKSRRTKSTPKGTKQ